MLHSFVAPSRFTSRTSRDVKKTNVLYSAESSITLLDVPQIESALPIC